MVSVLAAQGAVFYVAPNGGNTAPFTNWPMAARTVTAAVFAASAADTVLVSNGVYALAAPIQMTNDMVLQSVNGAAQTVLQGDGASRILYMAAAGAVVRSFTIAGGQATDGGGIYMTGGGTIRDCVISNNVAESQGGGVYMEYGGLLTNCLVTGNRAAKGGGLFTYFGGAAHTCTFSNNTAGNHGGGIYTHINGGPIDHCRVTMNLSSNHGGGLYLYGNGMTVTNCVVERNVARMQAGGIQFLLGGLVTDSRIVSNWTYSTGGGGGGIYCDQGGRVRNSTIAYNWTTNTSACGGGVYLDEGGRLEGCVVSNNICNVYGGGAYVNSSGGSLSGCRLDGNLADSGGGVLFSSAGGWMTNCWVLRNRATYAGGGIYFLMGGRVRNCLVAYNVASNGANGMGGGAYFTSGGEIQSSTLVDNYAQSWGGGMVRGTGETVMNSIVYFNLSGSTPGSNYYDSVVTDFFHCCVAPLPGGPGNIATNPGFQDRPAGNYQLNSSSPCVNTGTNQDWMTDGQDLVGAPRITEVITDMGAYELTPSAVRLVAFGVKEEAGEVTVCWQTASETDTLGFDLYRWVAGAWVKVNPDLIPARGWPNGGVGAEYCVADRGVLPGARQVYRLVEVETGGPQNIYGPFVEVRLPPGVNSVACAPGGVSISWASVDGETYIVNRARSVLGPYQPVSLPLAATPPLNTWTDPDEQGSASFYQVEVAQ